MLDNLDFFYAEERRMVEAERRRPHCIWCGEPIWQDKAFRMPNEGLLCDSCIEDNQEWVEEEEE